MKKNTLNRHQEERLNWFTHGTGFLLSIVGLIVLEYYAISQEDTLKIICFSVYGFSMVFLYGSSALYHFMHSTRIEKKLQILDHAAIYVLIAGTYTPLTLLVLRGGWGWSMFGVIWGLAIAGVIFKLFYANRFDKLSTIIYLVMGWLIVIAIKPMITQMPPGLWKWIIGGGLSYTGGIYFYFRDWKRFHHGVWHFFVLGGSAGHYIGVLLYLAPAGA